MPKFVLLWTDAAIWLMVAALVAYVVFVRRNPNLRANWRKVFADAPALASTVVLAACLAITLLDSLHFRRLLPGSAGNGTANATQQAAAYDTRTMSMLDALCARLVEGRETTYSKPLAYERFTKESLEVNGRMERVAPRLDHGGAHLGKASPAPERRLDVAPERRLDVAPERRLDVAPERRLDVASQRTLDVAWRAALGALVGGAIGWLLAWALQRAAARSAGTAWPRWRQQVCERASVIPWHVAVRTLVVLGAVTGAIVALAMRYHVFGTDVTGNDVLYQTLKSVRTAFVIGSLATLATLPLAVVLGVMAGYLRGWADEAIQYLYTVLSSIPNILLIAACVLMVNVFIDKNPDLFETALERADLKLFLLCVVLGLTGWAGLCRLLRAESMKLRELEYVQAAQAFGVGRWRIMARHVFPNVAHLMLIVTVLEFSALILYEAVLSYVGVGVDPSMNSFGGMINYARNEMSRDPVVWWPFAAAFVFMVGLVLAANLFADGVRDAFDPRSRAFRARPLAKASKAQGNALRGAGAGGGT